jgi:hypothetical protein
MYNHPNDTLVAYRQRAFVQEAESNRQTAIAAPGPRVGAGATPRPPDAGWGPVRNLPKPSEEGAAMDRGRVLTVE